VVYTRYNDNSLEVHLQHWMEILFSAPSAKMIITSPRWGSGILRSVCLSVCLPVRQHTSGTAGPIFRKLCMQIPYGRGSFLLWRRCDTSAESDAYECLVVIFHWDMGMPASVQSDGKNLTKMYCAGRPNVGQPQVSYSYTSFLLF